MTKLPIKDNLSIYKISKLIISNLIEWSFVWATFIVAQDRIAAERIAADRMAMGSLGTDPLVRLQMAGINPEVTMKNKVC